jgi:hypothetical protein
MMSPQKERTKREAMQRLFGSLNLPSGGPVDPGGESRDTKASCEVIRSSFPHVADEVI